MEPIGDMTDPFGRHRAPHIEAAIPALLLAFALAGCSPQPRAAWLGIDTRLGSPAAGTQPATAPVNAANREIDLDMLGELGISLQRVELMNWARIQPAPNARYDFSVSDEIVKRAQQKGVDLLAVCGGIPGWAALPPAGRVPSRETSAAFAAFVRAFVERYDGDSTRDMPGLLHPLRTYEFIQEVEDVPTADYAFWLKLFYETVKGVSPKSTIVLGSLKSPGVKLPDLPAGEYHTWFERLLAEPALHGPTYPYFDAVGFHNFPRRYPGRPPFESAVVYLRQVLAAHRLDRPLWLTAFGANSNDPNAGGEERQAADLIRWTIHARSLGIERMYLYTLRDDPPSGKPQASRAFGLVRSATIGGRPDHKPAFEAMALLLSLIKNDSQITRRADGVYMIPGDKEPTYVLWRVASYDPSPFLIPGWWEVRTLTGQRFVRQGADIKVTEQPVFIQRTTSPFIH